jgi:hypothetical protein
MDKPGTYPDDNRFTYKQFITEIGQQLEREINYKVLHKVVPK